MTLLADIFVEEVLARASASVGFFQSETKIESYNRIIDKLGGGMPKYRVMPQVYAAALEIYEEDLHDRSRVPLCQNPGELWMEWTHGDMRVGLFFLNDFGAVFTYHAKTRRWGNQKFTWKDGNFEVQVDLKREVFGRPIERSDLAPTVDKRQLEGFGVILTITQLLLSMMENPRLVEKQPKVIDTALQQARIKRGVRPLSNHVEVVIHVTRKEREQREAAEAAIKAGKKLHFVRMFHRVKRGKVERVREHWRGNASLGVKPKPERYRVSL